MSEGKERIDEVINYHMTPWRIIYLDNIQKSDPNIFFLKFHHQVSDSKVNNNLQTSLQTCIWILTYKPSGDFFRLDEAKIEIGVLDNARQCNENSFG